MHEKPHEKGKLGAAGMFTVAAYPASIAAGLYAAKQHIRHNSSEWHQKLGVFDDSLEELKSQAKGIKSKSEASGLSPQKELAKLREVFEKKKSDYFRKNNYKNVFHNLKDLSENARTEAVVTGLTVTGISLGALLMAAHSKDTFKQIFNDNNNDKSASR